MASEPLTPSDYEAQRQANIAKNQALLRELQLNAASAGIAPKAQKSRSATPSIVSRKKKTPVKRESKPVVATRSSSRLKGIVADSEVAKRKAHEEADLAAEQARAKRQRVSDDLDLSEVVVAGRDWNRSGNFLTNVRPANPYERTFTAQDVKETSDKELRALRERMSGLQLWEGVEPSRIKITPERIYSLGFHPTTDKPLVFAGDKLGNLGLFDGSQSIHEQKQEIDDEGEMDDADPAITTFKIHTRTISSFQFSPHDHNALYTASYDSSIRRLDLQKGRSVEVYAPEGKDEDAPLSGVEFARDDPHTVYFTTLEGSFGRHDVRAPPNNKGGTELFQLSEKKIGGFTLHPAQPHLVATASLDRLLRIWDLRKMTGRGGSRAPSLVGEHESRLSVSHAAFNSAGQVATASYDDTIKIYDFSSAADWKVGTTLSDEQMRPKTVIKHNNQTGRWVTMSACPSLSLSPQIFDSPD